MRSRDLTVGIAYKGKKIKTHKFEFEEGNIVENKKTHKIGMVVRYFPGMWGTSSVMVQNINLHGKSIKKWLELKSIEHSDLSEEKPIIFSPLQWDQLKPLYMRYRQTYCKVVDSIYL